MWWRWQTTRVIVWHRIAFQSLLLSEWLPQRRLHSKLFLILSQKVGFQRLQEENLCLKRSRRASFILLICYFAALFSLCCWYLDKNNMSVYCASQYIILKEKWFRTRRKTSPSMWQKKKNVFFFPPAVRWIWNLICVPPQDIRLWSNSNIFSLPLFIKGSNLCEVTCRFICDFLLYIHIAALRSLLLMSQCMTPWWATMWIQLRSFAGATQVHSPPPIDP